MRFTKRDKKTEADKLELYLKSLDHSALRDYLVNSPFNMYDLDCDYDTQYRGWIAVPEGRCHRCEENHAEKLREEELYIIGRLVAYRRFFDENSK